LIVLFVSLEVPDDQSLAQKMPIVNTFWNKNLVLIGLCHPTAEAFGYLGQDCLTITKSNIIVIDESILE